jgi:hypothetical protein
VNPRWHDEFVALCALFASGELTEQEWALLQVHLAYCDSCRVVFEQYQHLADNVMPVLAASASSESESEPVASSFSLEAAEQRLMSQLDSAPAEPESQHRRKSAWQLAAGLVAACALCVAGVIGLHLVRSKERLNTQTAAASNIEKATGPTVPAQAETGFPPQLALAQREVARLQQQLSAAEARSKLSGSVTADAERRLEAEQAERKTISEERDALSQQLSVTRAETQTLRDRSAEASTTTAQQVARTATLEAKLHDLNSDLDEKDRMLALDKEFLAHDREIRDLIGARDLYIADIYDVAQNGKTTKPFGRIFYTKDRSLVFYGYDLDKQAGLKQSVAFQAWGSGDDKQNVSLGLFYQDDTHKRWVLRFNDTKTLARLNMVFVTAEPQGGSAKPTGKPLLLAYLQVQPNHP